MITETEKIKEKKSVQNQILQYVKLWNTSSDIFWQRNHKFSVFLIFHIFKFLAHCNNLHVEEGKDQVKLNPECHNDHFQGGEGEDQIQLPPEKHVDHLHAEEGEY